jgi:hypothetical protein
MSDIFREVGEQNRPCCEGLDLEMAYMVGEEGHTKGLGIDVHNQYAPIFISSDQLRMLADAIDNA